MRAAVACLVLALGCEQPHQEIIWSAKEPFALLLAGYPYSQAEARRALAEGIGQFDGTVVTSGQQITLRYDSACNANINPEFAAAVSASNRREIVICPKFADAIRKFGGDEAKAADAILKHELGHVFGGIHTATGLMTAVNNGEFRAFQSSDIASICNQGMIISSRCAN